MAMRLAWEVTVRRIQTTKVIRRMDGLLTLSNRAVAGAASLTVPSKSLLPTANSPHPFHLHPNA